MSSHGIRKRDPLLSLVIAAGLVLLGSVQPVLGEEGQPDKARQEFERQLEAFRKKAAAEEFCPADWKEFSNSIRSFNIVGRHADLAYKKLLGKFELSCSAAAQRALAARSLELAEKVARLQKLAASSGSGYVVDAGVLEKTLTIIKETLPERIADGEFASAAALIESCDADLERIDPGQCASKLDTLARGDPSLSVEGLVRLYADVARTSCLTPEHSSVGRAGLKELVKEAQEAIRSGAPAAPVRWGALNGRTSPPSVVVKALLEADKDAYSELSVALQAALDSSPKAQAPVAVVPPQEVQPALTPSAVVPATPTAEPARPRGGVILDIWQSAWGDFSGFDRLVGYLEANHIREVNLNPGIPMKASWRESGFKVLQPIVEALRTKGIKVNFLYAELNYPIREYAEFLKAYRVPLGIDTIVDDSEFTDLFLRRFEQNAWVVAEVDRGLQYSAFVTMERAGNSGVGSDTRRWAVRHLDTTILMSYFSCNQKSQQEELEPLFLLADEAGKKVRIGLLLGGKKVGRETSCEQVLGPTEFQSFLRQLHTWAKRFASYSGIVLETDEKMPRFDVSPEPLE